MGILKYILPLSLSLFLSGCYDEFTPDIDVKPVLCLNSLVTAGEPISVSLSHSWLHTDIDADDPHPVNDATVSLFANDLPVSADYCPREGDRIKIVADSRQYGAAVGEVIVPGGVPIDSVEWDVQVIREFEWSTDEYTQTDYTLDIHARLSFSDPPSSANFFLFSYDSFPGQGDQDEENPAGGVLIEFNPWNLNYEAEPIFSEHIGHLDALSGYDSYGFTFFTDRQFSGRSYTLNLRFSDSRLSIRRIHDPDGSEGIPYGLILNLNSISPSYYNWCNFEWNFESGSMGELIEAGLADPIWGYSNVSSGAGVVAAQSKASYFLNLKDVIGKKSQ